MPTGDPICPQHGIAPCRCADAPFNPPQGWGLVYGVQPFLCHDCERLKAELATAEAALATSCKEREQLQKEHDELLARMASYGEGNNPRTAATVQPDSGLVPGSDWLYELDCGCRASWRGRCPVHGCP
jgi:hypothetical protein